MYYNSDCIYKKATVRTVAFSVCESNIQFQAHGAVVGAKNIGVDGGIGDPILHPVGDQKVVDAPAGVLLSGLEHIAPPGVAANRIGI